MHQLQQKTIQHALVTPEHHSAQQIYFVVASSESLVVLQVDRVNLSIRSFEVLCQYCLQSCSLPWHICPAIQHIGLICRGISVLQFKPNMTVAAAATP